MASSQCCWSPRTHTENLGRGVDLSLRLGDGAGAGHARSGRGRRRRGLGPRRSLTQRVQSPAASLASQTSRRARPRPPHASPLVSRPRVGVRPATPAGSRGPRCQPDGAREALVLLGVIVLQADLQLHRLQKPWGQAASAGRPPARGAPSPPPAPRQPALTSAACAGSRAGLPAPPRTGCRGRLCCCGREARRALRLPDTGTWLPTPRAGRSGPKNQMQPRGRGTPTAARLGART